MNKSIEIRLGTDDLKFAAGHMTLFPDGTKEPIHGHTYHAIVSIFLRDSSFEKMLPFHDLKESIRKICEAWHHKLLIPLRARDLKIVKKDEVEIEFHLCQKRYIIPFDEVALIETDNTSTEILAEEFARLLLQEKAFQTIKSELEKLEVHIEQRPRQGATAIWKDFE